MRETYRKSLWGLGGDELNYWNNTVGLDMDTSALYCTIPDVDEDNTMDGKEINGYQVKIITGWKSDGTPISEMQFISLKELDPLIPYGYNERVTINGNQVNITNYLNEKR